jgi:hypothetical protein
MLNLESSHDKGSRFEVRGSKFEVLYAVCTTHYSPLTTHPPTLKLRRAMPLTTHNLQLTIEQAPDS